MAGSRAARVAAGPDAASPLDSEPALTAAFAAGLERLLDQPRLEPLILVLANASLDPRLHRLLDARLRPAFEAVREEFIATLSTGHPLTGVEEDVAVFLRLGLIGYGALAATEQRRVGPWRAQFNLLRAFRPRRISQQAIEGVRAAYDPRAFNFNRPFLQRESLWRGELAGRAAELYYNKYPFAPLHGLLVPEREACHAQYLTRELHAWAWRVAGILGPCLPGIGLGYNSYGAYASVNHLHLQLFVDPEPLPVEDGRWRHNGGAQTYPIDCELHQDPGAAYARLQALHRAGQPYNLLYRPGRLHLCPRRPQGAAEVPPWSSGFTWYETAGAFVTFNRADYQALDADTLGGALARIAV